MSYLHTKQLTPETYLDWFVKELVSEATRCGLPIKGEETWRSQKLFEYSREYHFESSQISATLKRISRLASEANQTLPTLNGDLGSLYSTGTAASGKDHCPITSFFITTVEAAYLIRRKMTWLQNHPIEASISCFMVSRYLGGLPITLYANFCTRSVQDNLSQNLRLLKTVIQYPAIAKQVGRWIHISSSSTDYEALIKDPQCLPISLPSGAEPLVRRTIREGLPSIVKNRLLQSLFSNNIEQEKAHLVETLMSIRPVNPRLLNKCCIL